MNKVLLKYNNMSRPLKASLWFMISSVINKGIAFLTTPLFTRVLTKEEYGVVGLYSTWVVMLTIVITLSLATGVFNKAMIKYEDDKDGYTSSILILITILVSFFGLVYFVFQPFLNRLIGLPPVIIFMMFFEVLATTSWDLFSIRKRFEYEYRTIIITTVVVNAIATLLSYLLVKQFPEHRAEARVAGLVITHTVIYSFFYFLIIYRGKTLFNREYWQYSLKFNLPLIPHYLSQQVLNQSDRIMIGNICGKGDAGIYSLAYQVAVAMQLITNAVHVIFMPWCFQCLKEKNTKQIGKRAFQIELLIGFMCMTFSLFAPEFVQILGGDSYYSAIYIIPPVAMSVVFLTMYSFFGNIEFYFEKTKTVMIASVIVAVSNILLNAAFIPIYGFVAAGYTTLFCYIVFAALHYYFMKNICKKNKVDNPFNGKRMWTLAMVLAIISIVITIVYNYTVVRLVLAFTLLIVILLFVLVNKNTLLYGNK